MPPAILDFEFDDDNERKIAAHGLTLEQVLQILDDDPVVARNRRHRRALWIIIGRDHGGNCVAVPVEPTADPTVWRPITAWPCKASEWMWVM